jgi:hypothetical protein
MNPFLPEPLFALMLLFLTGLGAGSGVTNSVTEKDAITPGHYDLYVDSTGGARFGQVSRLPEEAFRQLPDKRKMTEPGLHYWLRFKIRNHSAHALVLETPREYRTAELYVPSASGYRKSVFDIYRPWGENEYIFNNPSFALPGILPEGYFYLHLRSDVRIGLGFWLFESRLAHNKAVKKLTQVFLVSGVLLLAILYTLVFLIRLRDRAFFYYLLYLVSLLAFTLTLVGATLPLLRHFTYDFYFITIPYAGITVSLLLYVDQSLLLKRHLPGLHRLLLGVVAFRVLVLLVAIAADLVILHQPFVDYLCLFPGYLAALVCVRKRFSHARLLFVSLTILLVAYTIRTVFKAYIPVSLFDHGQDNELLFYLFSILEVILLSFTLTERYLFLRKEKEQSQREIIQYQQRMLEESREKERLKEMLNQELETLVDQRTAELQQASEQLHQQARVITEMNKMLQEDNGKLSQQLVLVNKARLLEHNMSYEAFSNLFPDDDRCLDFVAGLKWQTGFTCRKCGYKKFYEGTRPHARQCKLCRYLESATANTLFENVKFSLQKALYILYYAYTTPGPNIHKLSQEIEIREGTCHNFYKKIEQKLQQIKPSLRATMNWTQFILAAPGKAQRTGADES